MDREDSWLIREPIRIYDEPSERHGYQDLQIWKRSVDLAVACYRSTEEFPKEEMYGLTSQIRRSSVSIASNIAEGWGRNSQRDRAHFLSIALGSLYELETLLCVARKIGLITEELGKPIRDECMEIGRMINGYRRKVLES